jgi:hypothetical protein
MGNLPRAPEPNSIRGKREREKSVIRTEAFDTKLKWDISEVVGALSAYELGEKYGREAIHPIRAVCRQSTWPE